MFKHAIQTKLRGILGYKVSFNAPSESFEQEVGFIAIAQTRTSAGQGRIRAKVTGYVSVFAQTDKMPFGYFAKKIAQAKAEHRAGFFFFDIDENVLNSPARMVNLAERRVSFVYLVDEQYDPNQGAMAGFSIKQKALPVEDGTGLSIDLGDGSVTVTEPD